MTDQLDSPTTGRPDGASSDGTSSAGASADGSRGDLASLDPRTGGELARYPIAGRQQVDEAVARAQAAAQWWRSLGAQGRKAPLLDFKAAIAARADDLAATIAAETGKPSDDALLEVMLAVEHLDWAARNAHKVLRRRRVPSGLVAANQSASVGYEPLGVVGVIGPWNYPVYTPMGSISYALAAGNAVVFKPSELTPGVGVWLADAWASLGAPHAVLQTVTGDGTSGAHLCRAGVDKIAFTGSTATAKRVMGLCAETLTPMVAECGGKDAMLVGSDADLDAAADSAAFGAMGNAGQTCVGVERVYVADRVADAFVEKLTAKIAALRTGGTDASYGPMTLAAQAEIVRSHIADALAKGGRAVFGGLDSVRAAGGPAAGPRVDPVVLVDVPEDSTAVTEETFGPTVVVNRVKDLDEAVTRANGSRYGLGASVFTKSSDLARNAAEQLRAGAVSINSVLGFAAVPALPFGGVGDSGFGRIHGADGLREFSRPKSLTVQRFPAPLNLLTMERKPRDMKISAWLLRVRHGRK